MLIKEDVAKRIAQSTNSDDGDASIVATAGPTNAPQAYQVGDHVRCTFSEDGVDYEADILSLKGDQCWVRYVGYNNEESVDCSTLIPSWGPEVREEQLRVAANEPTDSTATQSGRVLTTNAADPKTTALRHDGNKNKKSAASSTNQLQKAFDRVRNGVFIPPPPPLPPNFAVGDDDEDDGESAQLSSMLMAWYMSGYYTGLYQAKQLAKKSQKE